MPTTYTHYAYGQEVFSMLPGRIQKEILPYIDYYNIGVHGPDILFYYRSFCKNSMNQYGVKVHKEPMTKFLNHAFMTYYTEKRKEQAFAYLAGFMTHFILDSTCHPYVRKRIKKTGISHTEIETDWDSLMMQRDYRNPFTYKPAKHIHTMYRYAHVIAPYFDKTSYEVHMGLKYMKFILNHIFRSPFGVKRNILSVVNEFYLPDLHFQYYIVKKHINPKNKKTCKELMRLYKGSQKECTDAIIQLHEALNSNDISFCANKRFRRNFS